MFDLRKSLLASAAILVLAWCVAHGGEILGDDTVLVQFLLAAIYAVLVVVRRDPSDRAWQPGARSLGVIGFVGLVLGVIGIVAPVRQFEWIGLLCILFACLRGGLSERFGANLPLALAVLYLGHPLPTQLVGKFHLVMQWLSVGLSEWFLHALNVRVWADGLILRDGFHSYGVPEACSGLRTAYTVAVCALGLGIALRRRWFEILAFVVFGLAQVLAMNVLRISFMVMWAPRMDPEWAATFLHDSLGTFLLAAIVLIHVEVSLYHAWRVKRSRVMDGIISGDLDAPDKATVLPGTWRLVRNIWKPVLMFVLLVLVLVAAGYKRRASHRLAMMSDVIDGLMTSDPMLASRAIDAAMEFAPDDRGLKSQKAQALAISGRLEESLTLLNSLGELDLDEKVVKSSVLMMLGRPGEAIAIVDGLPSAAQKLPGVALLRAEYAAHIDEPRDVARFLIHVGHHQVFVSRVRALFPYLAAHRQWHTISKMDAPSPYDDIQLALIAVNAHLQMGRYGRAATRLKEARERWPDDIRFVGPTFLLAVQTPGSQWESQIEEDLYRHLGDFDSDTLATYLGYCFRIGRADLAWLLYARLAEIDADDPALHLAVAENGADWFTFRRRQLGLPSQTPMSVVDVRPLGRLTRDVAILKTFWQHIPFADDLVMSDQAAHRARHVRAARAELASREAAGPLGYRLALNYARALVMDQQYDEALVRYRDVTERFPDWQAFALLQQGVIHTQTGNWVAAYEALFDYRELTDAANLDAGLLAINGLMNLNLGAYALDMAQNLRAVFPQSDEITRAIAAIWDVFGAKEQALFLLGADVDTVDARATVQLLYDTGRYDAAQRMAAVLGVDLEIHEGAPPDIPFIPPARLAVEGRWPEPEPASVKREHAARLREEYVEAVSPFIRGLRLTEADWYASDGAEEARDLALWEAIGRNDREKATALHVLTMLLAQDRQREAAREAARAALRYMPASPPLWRMLIALSDTPYATTLAARAACPGDPAVWLAYLLLRYEEDGEGPWMRREAEATTESRLFSVGATIRAGDFFLSKGHPDVAALYARDAIKRGQGLLAVYVLGLRCAVELEDLEWAQSCAIDAIASARDPTSFYRVLLQVKASQGTLDSDVVEALRFLRERYPEEAGWSDILARAYFLQGDTSRAMAMFSSLVEETQGRLRPQSLLMASEVARLEGDQTEAMAILETAFAKHSQSLSVLNNLIYNLAQSPSTVPRAKRLLPRLLEMDESSFAVLDTAALVHLRSGDLEAADAYIRKALEKAGDRVYGLPEARLNAAEINLRLGRFDEAKAFAEKTLSDTRASDNDTMRARKLIDTIRRSRGR